MHSHCLPSAQFIKACSSSASVCMANTLLKLVPVLIAHLLDFFQVLFNPCILTRIHHLLINPTRLSPSHLHSSFPDSFILILSFPTLPHLDHFSQTPLVNSWLHSHRPLYPSIRSSSQALVPHRSNILFDSYPRVSHSQLSEFPYIDSFSVISNSTAAFLAIVSITTPFSSRHLFKPYL